MAANPDVAIAYSKITAKRAEYTMLWRYYDGDQPLVYSVKRLREVFKVAGVEFNENWCALVIDAIMERLQLRALTVPNNDALTKQLKEIMVHTELDLEDDPVHLSTLVTGEGFLIVWVDENEEPEAYYNDSRFCHVEYDSDNPHKKLWAAKMWEDASRKIHYMTLYYEDKLEYYVARVEDLTSAKAFELRDDLEVENPVENPYGVIPMFHFRRTRRQNDNGMIPSELENITPIQDSVNKLIADLMIAAEYGAFKQRWVISNAEMDVLKNAPNTIWDLPAGDGEGQQTSVGEFSATELKNYIDAIEAKVGAISAISRTPYHYFFRQGSVPSGEALIALEAPLNKKATRYSGVQGRTWQRVGQFLLLLKGIQVEAKEIEPRFDAVQTVQPKTEAEIVKILVESGVPLETALKLQGWTDEQIEEMQEAKKAEQAQQQASLAQALLAQQRSIDRGEGEV